MYDQNEFCQTLKSPLVSQALLSPSKKFIWVSDNLKRCKVSLQVSFPQFILQFSNIKCFMNLQEWNIQNFLKCLTIKPPFSQNISDDSVYREIIQRFLIQKQRNLTTNIFVSLQRKTVPESGISFLQRFPLDSASFRQEQCHLSLTLQPSRLLDTY